MSVNFHLYRRGRNYDSEANLPNSVVPGLGEFLWPGGTNFQTNFLNETTSDVDIQFISVSAQS